MPRDLYDCTAAELATHAVEHLQHDSSPSTAAEWLDKNGYDAAPIYADDDPIGFIHKDDVTTDVDDSRLHEVTELRNDVAPANLLVENTDSNEFLSSGRTTENLYRTLETIGQVLTNL